MRDPLFLSLDQVKLLHRYSLEQHGGQDGVRDRAALESAVVQPQNTWFYAQGGLFDVAAADAFHLAQSQAFLDGNKRTGMAAALTFLRLNGIIVAQHTDKLHSMMIAIAERRTGKKELAALFRTLKN